MWWWYHSSKHALEWLSDVLRFELDEFGIDVVVVQPGMIDTNFGNFAAQFIEKYESGSNYSHLFEPMAAMAEQMENSDEPMWDNPLVIAEAVEEAMNAKNPKIRYTRWSMANELIFMKNLLGDRIFDFLMWAMMG